MTTSKTVVRTIAEMARDNEQMTKTILGKFVVEECVKLNKKPFVFKEVKPLIDSCCYLSKQIEICTEKIETLNEQHTTMVELNKSGFPFPYEQREIDRVKNDLEDMARQKKLFTKQLVEAIEKL